jgi:hypothetical protein
MNHDKNGNFNKAKPALTAFETLKSYSYELFNKDGFFISQPALYYTALKE